MKNKINENREVIDENGELKTILCEETIQRGWMTIEEATRLWLQMVDNMGIILKERNERSNNQSCL